MGTGLDILTFGLAWYVVFLISLTAHEAAHALAALRLGDRTAYHGGQVTLDPVPHIRREPFGMVVVPIISYLLGGWMMGWASCPYDPLWAGRYPKRAALMGLAGPAANLVLVLFAAVCIHVGTIAGLFYAPERVGFTTVVASNYDGLANGLAILVSILFSLNLALFVFNLLPLPPLDGTGAMELVLKGDALNAYRQFTWHPSARVIGVIVAWTLFDVVFPPLHVIALNLLYPGAGYQ